MKTETNPAREREAAVERILGHAAMHSPYYQDQDWARRLRNGDRLVFSDLPLTPLSAVKHETSAFYAGYVPPSEGPVLDKYTSGSIGEPAKIKKTKRHFSINAKEVTRLRQGWGFEHQTGHVVTHTPSPKHPPGEIRCRDEKTNSWTIYSKEPRPTIELLCRTRCSYVTLYPSQAVSILELAPQLDFLRLISTVGEVVSPELKALLTHLPDCLHYDFYGSIETGMIAGTCRECGNYHFANRHLIVEILDDDNKPAEPGTMGRVVVTPLYNLAMPLVRYEIGDFAVVAAETECSKSRHALTRILGRDRNLFRLPNGSRIVPSINADDAITLNVRQFKLLQRSLYEIDFLYVPSSPDQIVNEADIQLLIDLNFSPLIKARPVRVTEIPASASGKQLMHESLVPAVPQ